MSVSSRFLAQLGRRDVVRWLAAGAALGLAACGAPAAPTTAPAKPAEAPKPPAPAAAQPTQPAVKPTAPPATAAPKPTTKPTAAPIAKAAGHFRMGVPDIKFDTVFELLAVEKGYYKEMGVDAEIIPIASGVEPIRGLVAGEFDFVEHGSTAAFSAIEQGAPIKFAGTIFMKFPHQMYTKKEITDLKQLYGQPFGMSAAGDSFEAMPRATFIKRGLDHTQLNLIPVGGSVANFQALIAGKLDACTSALEQIQLLEQNPDWDAKVFLAYGDELPNYMRTGGVVSDRGLREKKDVLTAALLAHVRGARYALDNKAESIAWAVEKASTKEDIASWAFDQYRRLKLVHPDFTISPEAVSFTQDTHLQIGMQKTKFDAAKSVDASIPDAILAQLGPYKW